MSIYDPLRDYLQRQTGSRFTLSFTEIEKILGRPLPASANRPQWWANVRATQTHNQREAWRKAGYNAFLEGASRVRFERV